MGRFLHVVVRRFWHLAAIALLTIGLGSCSADKVIVPSMFVRDGGGGDRELDGTTISGLAHIFVASAEQFEGVKYFLDGQPPAVPAMLPSQGAPFELALETEALTNGKHYIAIMAEVSRGTGIRTVTGVAHFQVENPGPQLQNSVPTVEAGPDAEVNVGEPLLLQGAASDDGLPAPLSTSWSKAEGPGLVQFEDGASLKTVAKFDLPGVYRIQLTAFDGLLFAIDDLVVTVKDVPEPPETPEPEDDDPVPSPGPTPEYDHFEQIYVSPQGSDSGRGTLDEPIKSISAGLQLAYENARDGVATRVLLMPGVYRQSVMGGFGQTSAPIVVEAYQRGRAIISGADLFTDWVCSESRCTHDWPHDWGAADNPWPGAVEIGELARRRELVSIDGKNLKQVLSGAQLTPGSFYVDEARDRLTVVPEQGTNLAGQGVEVGIRPTLWRTQGLNHLELNGLVFRHAASQFRGSAVAIVDQTDVTVRYVTVEDNGQTGLSLGGRYITLVDSQIRSNGSSGVSGYRIADSFIGDVTIEWNNWRGVRGNYIGWEVGNKFLSSHRVVLQNVTSRFNQSRGLWLDSDHSEVEISGALICDNLRDGIFVEANQGPITVTDSKICNNGEAGILTSATKGLTVIDTLVAGNDKAQLRFSGDSNRNIRDFETGQDLSVRDEDWVFVENQIFEDGGGDLVSTTLSGDRWETLMSRTTLDHNLYASTAHRPFRLHSGIAVDFEGWKERTGQDGSSSFSAGSGAATIAWTR